MSKAKKSVLERWEYREGKAGVAWTVGLKGDAKTTSVQLPHSWNTQDTFQEGLRYRRGWGSYRVKVDVGEVPAGAAYLVSEGFYGVGDLWINGVKRFEVNGNFLGFRFRVDAFLKEGENWVCLRLTNKHFGHVLPGIKEPDFVLHGGLAGRVFLKTYEGEHFQVGKIRVEARCEDDGGGQVEVMIPLSGACRSASSLPGGELLAVLKNSEGREVARECVAVAKGQLWLSSRLTLDAPRRWDVDCPVLYLFCLCYRSEGEVLDVWERQLGFRTTEWRNGEGFFLNGRRLSLRGVNRHESMPGFGNALPIEMHGEDAVLIKESGFNLVRLSHYPQHPAFLRACDALGILVYAEIASWKSVRGGRWLKEAKVQMRGMIERDAYHASVILWGMGNEGRHERAFKELGALVRKMDPSRPTIYAENHQYRARRHKAQKLPDIMGVNYELDELEAARDESANQLLLVSEMSNCPRWRGDVEGEEEQVRVLQEDLKVLEGKAYVTGWVLWCLCDYATMRKKRFRRPSGIYDAWRQPKEAAYWMRDRFGGEKGACFEGGGEAVRLDVVWTIGEACRADLRVVDEAGRCCVSWEGGVRVRLEGGGLLHAYTAAGDVFVSRGCGRIYFTPVVGERGRLCFSADGLSDVCVECPCGLG